MSLADGTAWEREFGNSMSKIETSNGRNCRDCNFGILDFTDDLLSNTDEYDWITFLRNNTNELQEFDKPYESSLWNAGKRINQRYFICMYALQVCGEKLKEQKESKN